jgi:hypothetical protein
MSMRISVCEFLRLKTNRNWFYSEPGHWVSGAGEYDAYRVSDELFELHSRGRRKQTLEYFEGLPSNFVRAEFKAACEKPAKKKRRPAKKATSKRGRKLS